MALSPLLNSYDHVLLDLDGCVWVQDTLTPQAREALAALRGAGKGLAFVTNDSRLSPEDYVRKLWSLGLQASLEEVVTVGRGDPVPARRARLRRADVRDRLPGGIPSRGRVRPAHRQRDAARRRG